MFIAFIINMRRGIYMKKAWLSRHRQNLFLPISMICLILFVLYTIVDTAIKYDSIPLWAIILSIFAAFILMYTVIRFSFIRYEYLFVSNEFIIRRYGFKRVTLVASIPVENIRSITKPLRAPFKPKRTKPYNLCNTIYGTIFSSVVITYTDVETAIPCKALIDPPANARKLLKLNLEKKYRA